jgi:O-antigen ligase
VPQATALPPAARRTADVLLAWTAITIPLSTTGMQIGVMGLGVVSLTAFVWRWGVIRHTPLDGVLALFYGVLGLSTLASLRPWEAAGWDHLWVVLAYFTIFWWADDRARRARFVRLLVWSALLVAAYAILQHYTGLDWYRGLLGRPTQVRLREPGASGYAVVGFFGNYLTFAHTMLFPLAWASAFALRADPVGIFTSFLLVLALVFSTARGVWLALVAMVVSLALVTRERRALIALAAIGLAAGIGFAIAPDLRSHAANMFYTSGGNRARVAIYEANLDIIHEHPVLGLGFGRYKHAAQGYYDGHPDADRRSHAHNNYLQIAAEAGLLGLAAFGLVFATALRTGWTALARAPDPTSWAVAAGAWVGIVAFLAGGVTQYTFGDNEVALTMWVCLGILMRAAWDADAAEV